MIGVLADPAQEEVVREFFELFKTPWEFYRQDHKYDVVLCSGNRSVVTDAKLVIIYAGNIIEFDDENNLQPTPEQSRNRVLVHQEKHFPIYGGLVTFPRESRPDLEHEESRQPAAWIDRSEDQVVARIGYNLFEEIGILLTKGQPVENANSPTLELHIAFLRNLVTSCGLPLVEIPPIPEGYAFIACLTHDVDHPSIQKHKWDHTMLGFLLRAVVGSVRDVIRGRASMRHLLANWLAVAKLPFVHLGIAKDFWCDFGDQYRKLEKNLPSTFFLIPFKARPGKTAQGIAPSFRASSYGAAELKDSIQMLQDADCEIGVHGIDAWVDVASGQEELEELRKLTRSAEIGIRMHWLYFDESSPTALEKAGFAYDSTVGYNGAVGYRAGTTQAFKPLSVARLLELPLVAMDTALFYPSHLGLSSREGLALIDALLEDAQVFGGCFTVNWHDRSLAPERQWDGCYRALIERLENRNVWFATAQQATEWFRKRRSVVFERDSHDSNQVLVKRGSVDNTRLPGLQLCVHDRGKTDTRPLNLQTTNTICFAHGAH